MGWTKGTFLGSVFDVLRFGFLCLLILAAIGLFFYEVEFDSRGYNLVFISRVNTGYYYGIELGSAFEVWKVEKSDDGQLSIQRLYPI